MEAKDTVMRPKQMYRAIFGYEYNPSSDGEFYLPPHSRKVAEAQAIISFKAGIKEVVEWMKVNGEEDQPECGDWPPPPLVFAVDLEAWQAKLKEWEVK